jgi:hypothetical protein
MSAELITEYRLEDNLCTLLGFDPNRVKTIHLYASRGGKLYYKVTGFLNNTDNTKKVEVQSWYEVNKPDQYLPISGYDAKLKKLDFQRLGQIYPHIEGLRDSEQYV